MVVWRETDYNSMEWASWGKQLLSMEQRKCNQNMFFSFSVSDFCSLCSVFASVLPCVSYTVEREGFQ